MMTRQARPSAKINGFDTHMILEAVPAGHSEHQNGHQATTQDITSLCRGPGSMAPVTRHNSRGWRDRTRLVNETRGAEAPTWRLLRLVFLQVRAVEVGFEPTEDLRLHTLSRRAFGRSPTSTNVPDQREQWARGHR